MIQKRLHTRPVQLRSEQAEDGTHVLIGYASVFNALSEEIYPGVKERIEPGAFSDALKTSDVRALFNHDQSLILGRTSAGTLVLEEDGVGLRYEIRLPNTQLARDLLENVRLGNVRENSFAFSVDPANIRRERISETEAVDVVTKVDRVWDISPVTYPAYPAAGISAFRHNPEGAAEGRTSDAVDVQAQVEAHKRKAIALEIARLDFTAIEVNHNA